MSEGGVSPEEADIAQSTAKQEAELTPEQAEKFKQIMTVRREIDRFDDQPRDFAWGPYYHSEWVKNRPYQTKEEAAEAFSDLVGISAEDANGLFAEQREARANKDRWDRERMYSPPWVTQPSAQWSYHKAYGKWVDTLKQEEDLINNAVRGNTSPQPPQK